MYLYCQIDERFAEKINYEQGKDALDRMMKSLSNMVPNERYRSPQQCFNRMTGTPNADFLALTEEFYGRSAASLMDSQ